MYDSEEGAGYRGGADYDYGDHAGMEAEDYTDHPALQPEFVTSPGQIFVDPGASVNMSCSVAKWVVSHLSQYNWCNCCSGEHLALQWSRYGARDLQHTILSVGATTYQVTTDIAR